ncbi:hypothetical protein BH24ACT3_BH24ACT3_04470 [soil metagenome]
MAPASVAPSLSGYLTHVRRVASDTAPAEVLAAVATALAADLTGRHADDDDRPALIVVGDERCPDRPCPDGPCPDGLRPPPELAEAGLLGPDLLGLVRETLLDADHRHRRGVHYTPRAVAEGVVAAAVAGWPAPAAPRVCDPAVGGGAFLLAAARWLADTCGLDRRTIVADLLWGADIDPLAVAVTEATLWLWAAGDGAPSRSWHLAVADVLAAAPPWSDAPPDGFDLVIGNPPFGNQLGSTTARRRAQSESLRSRFGPAVRGYADTAAVFLLACRRMARVGGRVSLVQPESFLAARDAAAVRVEVLDGAALTGLWVAAEPVFAAGVDVCAPVLEVGATTGAVARSAGGGFGSLAPARTSAAELRDTGSWAPLAAGARGVPDVAAWATSGVVGDRWRATAGFRDQYYGLVDHVREAADVDPRRRTAPLLTSGLVEPLELVWGRRPVRFAKRHWTAPVVDLDALAAAAPVLAAWVDARLTAKVVVAAQTRVVEAAVDATGTYVPSVPLIAVTAIEADDDVSGDDLGQWLAAAALSAPPVTAWALTRYGGAGLSGCAVKLSARQVLAVPLPAHVDPWRRAAERLRCAHHSGAGATERRVALVAAAAELCQGYGLAADHPVLDWWRDRLPAW